MFEGAPGALSPGSGQARRRGARGDGGRGDPRRGPQPDLGRPRGAEGRGRRISTGCVDCADALGAEVLCGPFHQPLGRLLGARADGGRARAAGRGAPGDGRPGGRAGLTLAIEPLNRFECYVLTTNAQAAAHVARVGRPNFGYLYDTFHSNIEEARPGRLDRRDHRRDRATSTSRRTTAARPAAGTSTSRRRSGRRRRRATTAGSPSRPSGRRCRTSRRRRGSGGRCSRARTRWWRPARG